MRSREVERRPRGLESALVLGVVGDVLAHAFLAASVQADDGRPSDEVARDGLLEPLELVASTTTGKSAKRE